MFIKLTQAKNLWAFSENPLSVIFMQIYHISFYFEGRGVKGKGFMSLR